MHSELTLKLLNGSVRYGILNQTFNPSSGHVDFFCKTSQRSDLVSLDEICFIKFPGKPDLDEKSRRQGV